MMRMAANPAHFASPAAAFLQHALSNPARDKTTVYVARSGKKRHRAGCSLLRNASIPISLKDTSPRATLVAEKR